MIKQHLCVCFLMVLSFSAFTQTPVSTIQTKHKSGIQHLTFAPDGQQILSIPGSGGAKLWDLNGKKLQAFGNKKDCAAMAAFSPNGKFIITGCDTGFFQIWDRKTGQHKLTRGVGDNLVFAVNFSPQGLAEVHYEGGINQYRVKRRSVTALGTKNYIAGGGEFSRRTAIFSQDDQFMLNPTGQALVLYDKGGKKVLEFGRHDTPVIAAAISADNQYILTGSSDRTVNYWNISGELLQSFKLEKEFQSLSFSPDGKYFITDTRLYSYFSSPEVYDIQGNHLQQFSGQQAICFSPNGKSLATGSARGEIHIWEMP